MEESDFIVIRLEEDGVLEVGPHVHRSFIGNSFVMAGSTRLVRAGIGRAPERHTIMLLFLLSERLLLLLLTLLRIIIKAIFLFEEHLIVVSGVEWRLIIGVIDDIITVRDVIVDASFVGIHRVMFLVVVILVVDSCFVVRSVFILARLWMVVVVRLILIIGLLSLMMLRLSSLLGGSCSRRLLLGRLSRGRSRCGMRSFSCFGLGLLMFVGRFLLWGSFLMVSRFGFGGFFLDM